MVAGNYFTIHAQEQKLVDFPRSQLIVHEVVELRAGFDRPLKIRVQCAVLFFQWRVPDIEVALNALEVEQLLSLVFEHVGNLQ